jgi:hypothetical protein
MGATRGSCDVADIPVLPNCMGQVLQSFMPFLVGLHSSMRDRTLPRDVVRGQRQLSWHPTPRTVFLRSDYRALCNMVGDFLLGWFSGAR